jgi:hypothetical protein
MTALDDRGEKIANWWRDNPGEHSWAATLLGVGMQDSAKSRAARTRACAISVKRGDQVAYAVYANGCTWKYVAQGESVADLVDPMLHSSVTAAGVKRKERSFHDHMSKERMHGLNAEERELVQIQIDYEKNRRETEELHARQMKQLVRMRNRQLR